MTGLEYFFGLILLLLGFNVGFHEAGKGLTVDDFKRFVQPLLKKMRR
ncbi:MAG: hypothetical protein ACE5IY_16590 [bacterium]